MPALPASARAQPREAGSSAQATGVQAPSRGWLRPELALLAVFLGLVGFRLLLSREMVVPTLYTDEMGYLANARQLAGRGGPLFAPGTPFASFGYSLLLVPLYWLFGESLEVFHWALRLNAVAASTVVFSLYFLARSLFAVRRGAAVWVAALASLYPPLLVHSNFVWTENVLPVLFATWVLAAAACARRATWGAALSLAVISSLSYATHPRALPLSGIAIVYLAYLAWSRRMRWIVALGALAVLGGTLGATVATNRVLFDVMWELGRTTSIARLAAKAVRPALLPELLLVAVGQSWYLLASTLGLAAIGAVKLGRSALTPTEPGAPSGARGGAALASIGALSLFAVSVLFCAGGRRIDHLVYGRYNEILVPVLLLSFFAWLQGADRQRIRRAVLVGAAALLAMAPIVALVRFGHAYSAPSVNLVVTGVLPFEPAGERPVIALDFPAITLASVACALLLGLLLTWRMRIALVLLAGGALLGAFRIERGFVTPYASWFPVYYTLHDAIRTVPGEDPVAYDTATARRENVNAYQFHTPEREAILFDSRAEAPPARLVVASKDWPVAADLGATLLAAESTNDHGLWSVPASGLDGDRRREIVWRYEAESLPTQVPASLVAESIVADPRASGGAARRGWDEVLGDDLSHAVLVYGPYQPLQPGRYEVRYRVAVGGDGGSPPPAIRVDVCAGGGTRILASREVVEADLRGVPDYRTITLPLETDVLLSDAEFRVFYAGGGEIRVDYVETARQAGRPAGAGAIGPSSPL